MARQGVSRPKVVSSGRLTGSGRGQIHKKKVAGRCVAPLEPAYSLYSTDSEDQVTTIHKGLDRCAALLNGMLQSEQAESKPKPQVTKTCTFKSKTKTLSRKFESDKKKHGKKTNTSMHANKRPAPVQKTIVSAKSHMSLTGRGEENPEIRLTEESQDQPSRLTHAMQAEHDQQKPLASCNLPSSGQVHTSTAFNCRLTTSTPALSPQRPGSTHSEPCTSMCVLSSGRSSMRSMSAATPSWPHVSAEMSDTPNLYAASFSMPPPVQRQSPVTVSPVQNGSCTPKEHEVHIITSPICSVPRLGSKGPNVLLASSIGSLTCPSSSLQEKQILTQPQVIQAQSDSNGPALMICNDQNRESLTEGDISIAEDEKDGMDTTPVKDTSFQSSSEKLTALNHKTKTCSPEKTAQRVITVKYLLGELKTLVANQDSDAVRLISEVEQSISLLPVMVGSTNIQAEIALALQPLRSENVQLRRRLRILNQQLLERERAERRARPESCDMEVVALQSLNLTLQTQLNESRREFDDLQQENMRLRKGMEDKDSDLKHHKDLCELENSRLRLEVNEALAEMQNCQSKLKDYEIEKTELTLSLQQRETEIGRLQEVIRSLQRSQAKDASRYSPQIDVCQPNSHLTKTVLELHENAQRDAAVSVKQSNSVKTYLQTMKGIERVAPPNHIQCRSSVLQPAFSGQTSASKVCSPYKHKPTLETIVENVTQLDEQKKTIFAPLRETASAKNQWKDVNVLKNIGHVFEKLDISEGSLIQDDSNNAQDCFSDHPGVALHLNHKNSGLSSQPVQSQHARRGLRMGVQSAYTGRPSAMDNTFSSCDIKSLASDWSINSWSTFNTQDEQNFRDGLAALDASIESLQKTLKIDRNK